MMQQTIIQTLRDIEQQEHIKILHAAEAGSRAWGFASPDSDYDVRFIYVREKAYYLRLEETRDVIELPVSDELDISGWDLDKALRLLYKSNPSLFEWFSSPIVYIQTDFYDTIQPYLKQHFVSIKGIYHYFHMASGNYRAYLCGETAKVKKYLNVLRGMLACCWIMHRRTPPPMAFDELREAELAPDMQASVEQLLRLKRETPGVKEIPAMQEVNAYIERLIAEITAYLAQNGSDAARTDAASWEALDALFLSQLE